MNNPLPDARRIFEQALALTDPGRRAAWLQAACGQDQALWQEVESLLKALEQAGDFFDRSPTLAAPDDAQERPGAILGPYKLLEIVGEGGFGTVWMAEQQEPVRRRVALKIIKLGMDTKFVRGGLRGRPARPSEKG